MYNMFSKSINILLTATLIALNTWKGCVCIEFEGQISEQVVVVENGTAEDVVLDCPYILEEEDQSGLVIKWSYEGFVYPIFQWIPDGQIKTPQLVEMDDVIDATHAVSTEPLHKHRALRLLSPTTEVHGLYTCEVSSHLNEEKLNVRLIVYTLPSALSLYVDDSDPENITVMCVTEPAFPEPKVELSLIVADTQMALESLQETNWSAGLYNSTLTAIVNTDKVSAAPVVQFSCSLSIPHTNLSVTESLKYRSDGLPIYDDYGKDTLDEDDEISGEIDGENSGDTYEESSGEIDEDEIEEETMIGEETMIEVDTAPKTSEVLSGGTIGQFLQSSVLVASMAVALAML